MKTSVQSQSPLMGVGLVVLAMVIIGLIDNYIRVIAEDAGVWQFHMLRSLMICALLGALALAFGWRARPVHWRPVVLRSFLFSSSMVLYFGAAGMLPIAQVGAGLFSSPIWVLVVSVLFLGTRVGLWRVVAVAIGFSGVILILKPNATDLSLLTFLPVIAGLLYALAAISTRRWCGAESTTTLLFGLFIGLGIWGALGLIWFAIFPPSAEFAAEFGFFAQGWVTPTPRFWALTFMQASVSLVAVGALTRGYQLVEVSFVTVFEYTFLISAAFWAYLLYGDVLDARSTLGIGLIIVAGVIIALRSR